MSDFIKGGRGTVVTKGPFYVDQLELRKVIRQVVYHIGCQQNKNSILKNGFITSKDLFVSIVL